MLTDLLRLDLLNTEILRELKPFRDLLLKSIVLTIFNQLFREKMFRLIYKDKLIDM